MLAGYRLLALALGAIVAPNAGNVVASAGDPCAHARALSRAGYHAEAQKAYVKLAGVAPCATTRRLVAAREAAKPPVAKASEQLKQAQRLQNAGFDKESRELTKAVAKDSAVAIPHELRAVDQRPAKWRDKLGQVGPPARAAVEILAAGIGAFLVALLALTVFRALYLRFCRAARLDEFAGASDEAMGPVLSAGLRNMLARMNDDNVSRETTSWQNGTEPKFSVPASVTDVVPQVGLVAGLVQMVDRLLYRRLYIVAGTVHPVHEKKGAGLTLVVTRRTGRTVGRVTIWEDEFMLRPIGELPADTARYERLIVPAAVWLGYCKALGYKGNGPLRTDSWKSYALFAVCDLLGDGAQRRLLFERALDLDASNLGARLNLAALLLVRPKEDVPPCLPLPAGDGRRDSWHERLNEAGAHLQIVADEATNSEAIWYRARYMQAVRHVYLNQGREAKEAVDDLRTAMQGSRRNKRLSGLFIDLKQLADVVDLIAELQTNGSVGELPEICDPKWLPASVEYNLAGFWSRYVVVADNDEDRRAFTVEAGRRLRRTIERRKEAATWAQRDPDFDAIRENDVFKAVIAVKPDPPVPPVAATRYEIAVDPGPQLRGFLGIDDDESVAAGPPDP